MKHLAAELFPHYASLRIGEVSRTLRAIYLENQGFPNLSLVVTRVAEPRGIEY